MIVLDFFFDLWAVFLKYGGGDPTKGAVLVVILVSLFCSFVASVIVEALDRTRDRKHA